MLTRRSFAAVTAASIIAPVAAVGKATLSPVTDAALRRAGRDVLRLEAVAGKAEAAFEGADYGDPHSDVFETRDDLTAAHADAIAALRPAWERLQGLLASAGLHAIVVDGAVIYADPDPDYNPEVRVVPAGKVRVV